MTPQGLAKLTIQAEASKDNTDFEDVTHRSLPKKAKVEYGDFRKISKSALGDRDIQDEISFLNIEVDYVAKGDKITHNNVDYYVEYFSPVMPGICNVFAIKKVRTGGML